MDSLISYVRLVNDLEVNTINSKFQILFLVDSNFFLALYCVHINQMGNIMITKLLKHLLPNKNKLPVFVFKPRFIYRERDFHYGLAGRVVEIIFIGDLETFRKTNSFWVTRFHDHGFIEPPCVSHGFKLGTKPELLRELLNSGKKIIWIDPTK